MKLINLPVILAVMVLVASCSPRGATQPVLPDSWYQLPEQNAGAPATTGQPAPDFDSRVIATFQAHTEALDRLAEPAPFAAGDGGGLKNWTPWHLDGMIANFTINIGGLFGVLMGDGTATVKGIWKQKRPEKPAVLKLKKPATVKFNGKMTEKDVPGMMEPLVRAAVATKSVADKDRLRRNLNRKGRQFLTLARALSRVKNRRAWKVEGFELQLSFDAYGQISPSVGVGGTFTVYLEWEREDGGEPGGLTEEGLTGVDDSPIYRNLNAFTDLMASLIPEFRAESAAVRRYGFEFSEFQVGVSVTAGGDIGIAALAGSVSGKLKFKKAGAGDRDFVEPQDAPEPPESVVLKIIGPAADAERMAFAAANNIRVSRAGRLWGTDEEAMVYEVTRGRFREGMKNAMTMAGYFAGKARSADTARWAIDHLEAEFSASITGDLKVVTVSVQGQVTLGFDRLEN